MAQYANLFAEPGDPEYAPPVKEAETPVLLWFLLGIVLVVDVLEFYIVVA